MHNAFPARQRAYSNRFVKVAYSRRGGLLRLTGRLATSRTSFLSWEGVADYATAGSHPSVAKEGGGAGDRTRGRGFADRSRNHPGSAPLVTRRLGDGDASRAVSILLALTT
jgi:hypothetical protein